MFSFLSVPIFTIIPSIFNKSSYYYYQYPRMGTSNAASVLGSCFAGVTLIVSLFVMGESASIVAHDHASKIGIVHLAIVRGILRHE